MMEIVNSMIQPHWHLLPCHAIDPRTKKCSCRYGCKSPGKHPRTKNGVLDATNNWPTIQKWIESYEHLNLGVRTGEESCIWILDIDFKSPQYIFPDYELLRIQTLKVETSRGWHLYFNWPNGEWLRNRGNIFPKVDVRGSNGYCILPLRNNGYRWVNDLPIVNAPQWLLDKVIGL